MICGEDAQIALRVIPQGALIAHLHTDVLHDFNPLELGAVVFFPFDFVAFVETPAGLKGRVFCFLQVGLELIPDFTRDGLADGTLEVAVLVERVSGDGGEGEGGEEEREEEGGEGHGNTGV